MCPRGPGGRPDGPKSVVLSRLYPLLWVTEMEQEVASDLSAFHRVDDMWSMGSRRWALLVPRLYAYTGAVRARTKALMAQDEERGQDSAGLKAPPGGGGAGVAADGTPLLPGPPSPLQGGQLVESTQTALRMSDIGDMFSFATVAAPAAG